MSRLIPCLARVLPTTIWKSLAFMTRSTRLTILCEYPLYESCGLIGDEAYTDSVKIRNVRRGQQDS